MSSRPRQLGVTLLEALIALLVLAFGLLTFAALQARLRINSDVAKQRTEAVRIAQEDLENFRAFGTLAADAGVANNFAYSQIATAAAQ
jgi:type IV pilus modification protein PilV